jgi:hypothetical protein
MNVAALRLLTPPYTRNTATLPLVLASPRRFQALHPPHQVQRSLQRCNAEGGGLSAVWTQSHRVARNSGRGRSLQPPGTHSRPCPTLLRHSVQGRITTDCDPLYDPAVTGLRNIAASESSGSTTSAPGSACSQASTADASSTTRAVTDGRRLPPRPVAPPSVPLTCSPRLRQTSAAAAA